MTDDTTILDRNYAIAIAALRYCKQQEIDLSKEMPNDFDTDTPTDLTAYQTAIDMLEDDRNWL